MIKRATVSIIGVIILIVMSAMGSSVFLSAARPAAAQDVSVVVEGPLQSINNNSWVVNNLTIEVTSSTMLTGVPIVGSKVKIIALQRTDGRLTAQSIIVTVTISQATAVATMGATATATTVATPAATMVATTAATGQPFQYVKIIIEGPVEAVDLSVNIVVVYKQRIRLREDNPLRLKIKVGDWIHVDGNLERENDQQLIIVVVNIIIINAPSTIIIIQPGKNNPPSENGGGKGMGMGMGEDD